MLFSQTHAAATRLASTTDLTSTAALSSSETCFVFGPVATVLTVSSSFDRKGNADPPLVGLGVVGLDQASKDTRDLSFSDCY